MDEKKPEEILADQINNLQEGVQGAAKNDDLVKQKEELRKEFENKLEEANKLNDQALSEQKKVIDILEKKIAKIEDEGKPGAQKSKIVELIQKQAGEEIKSKDKRKNPGVNIPFALANKAISLGSFAEVADPDRVPARASEFTSPIMNIRDQFNILDFVNLLTVSSGRRVAVWTEQVSESGDAIFLDCGELKPVVTLDFKVVRQPYEKVAAFETICDEVLDEVEWFEATMANFLSTKVREAIIDQILNGDGVSPNLAGIIPRASTFATTSLNASTKMANHHDALLAALTQLNCLFCNANYIFINCIDSYRMKVIKDADGNYILPTIFEGDKAISGVQIVETNYIPEGNFLIGDFNYAFVEMADEIRVDAGLNLDDFQRNRTSMRAETQMVLYVPCNRENCFLYGNFDTIIALIDDPS